MREVVQASSDYGAVVIVAFLPMTASGLRCGQHSVIVLSRHASSTLAESAEWVLRFDEQDAYEQLEKCLSVGMLFFFCLLSNRE